MSSNGNGLFRFLDADLPGCSLRRYACGILDLSFSNGQIQTRVGPDLAEEIARFLADARGSLNFVDLSGNKCFLSFESSQDVFRLEITDFREHPHGPARLSQLQASQLAEALRYDQTQVRR